MSPRLNLGVVLNGAGRFGFSGWRVVVEAATGSPLAGSPLGAAFSGGGATAAGERFRVKVGVVELLSVNETG